MRRLMTLFVIAILLIAKTTLAQGFQTHCNPSSFSQQVTLSDLTPQWAVPIPSDRPARDIPAGTVVRILHTVLVDNTFCMLYVDPAMEGYDGYVRAEDLQVQAQADVAGSEPVCRMTTATGGDAGAGLEEGRWAFTAGATFAHPDGGWLIAVDKAASGANIFSTARLIQGSFTSSGAGAHVWAYSQDCTQEALQENLEIVLNS